MPSVHLCLRVCGDAVVGVLGGVGVAVIHSHVDDPDVVVSVVDASVCWNCLRWCFVSGLNYLPVCWCLSWTICVCVMWTRNP